MEAIERYKIKLLDLFYVSVAFLKHLLQRLGNDRLQVSAGYMAYVTLLSLVPLLTVLLSALSIFPSFDEAGNDVKDFLLQNFVPSSSEVLESYLNQFIDNAGKMTAVGVGFLFVVAIMLISAIDKTLNYIWRTNKKRPPVISFSIYWMVLTLGPVLVGTSVALSSYISILSPFDDEDTKYLFSLLITWLPFTLTSLAFLGLYTLVPNTKVKIKHALIGAVTAGFLFEFSKKAFAIYVKKFPSYELIYGALAVIPLLFMWVYLIWCIVLLGAEITVALSERHHWLPPKYRGDQGQDDADVKNLTETTAQENDKPVIEKQRKEKRKSS